MAKVFDETTVQGRLMSFIRSMNMPVSAFERQCGMSNATISNMRKSLSQDKVENMAREFPQLNVSWVLTGKGKMLLGEDQEEEVQVPVVEDSILLKKENEFLLRENADLRERIEELKNDKATLTNIISSLEMTIAALREN